MSKEDSFGFTHLVEEDDDDEAAPIGNGNLQVDLQPHLGGPPSYDTATRVTPSDHGGFDNPALQIDDGDCGLSERTLGPNVSRPRGSSQTQQTADPSASNGQSNPTHSTAAANTNNNEGSVNLSSIQVQYDSSQGKVNVMQSQVSTRPDGTRYIDTQGIPQRWSELQRPLRQRRIKYLKIFSIISCIFFFPSGIPAIYYAFRTEREFNEGIMRGNIDRAQKFAKRSESLIILSLVMSVVVAALVVAIIERPYFSHRDHAHKGAVVG
ncbi:uncharacterized protein LOC101861771 [Aplysia californica]|uniref:Uncharacterized protein LOC101861771 n=1 Tax=Aplysia californica TaxID=6500 RepID=A0ABM1W1Z5_APLCA|nr:uncharacterized protein LOC101861771 [Aplysia californica]